MVIKSQDVSFSTSTMDTGSYTDFSIVSAEYITKYTGIWQPQNESEKRQRAISATYTAGALLYGIYLHVVDIYNSWGDATRCMFLTMNIMCIAMSTIKMLILNYNRVELTDAFFYAQRHFWHGKYNPEERLIFSASVKLCTRYAIFAVAFLHLSLSGYMVTPIIENLGRNKSDRVLPFKMWVDWPLTETPYYELIFTIQVVAAYIIGYTYISPEMFLCVFNLHVIGQFRILQYRMLNFWNVESNEMNAVVMYTDHCYAALKKCVHYHQLIIEFCKKLEEIYTMTIFTHVAILSLLMGLDCYEILAADTSTTMLLTFVFHGIGSLIHLCFLTYTCHFMIEESVNINTTVYSGLWCTLPMNKIGRSLRSDLKFIMIRSLKPCCLTAGGFFPVSLETFTALLSSTFSYFTLMRQSLMRNEEE